MEQADSIELLNPEGKIASLPNEQDAAAVSRNIHAVRTAELSDVEEMEEVERLAFPTLFPPTRFRRELGKANTLYLVAARDWTHEERELGGAWTEGGDERPGIVGTLVSLIKLPFRALFATVGGRRRPLPPQHVAGLVGLWFVMDEAHVVIIGNRPGDRRKGIGELLLISAIEASIAQGSRVVTLEVRSSNQAARSLYHKYGFREVGVRKRYYADNNEDAIIMTTPPVQGDEYREHFNVQVSDHQSRWGASSRQIS